MKTKLKILFAVVVLFLNISCNKEDSKAPIDCLGESLFIKLKHTTDAANPKKINYEIEYTGDFTFSSVKWTFGDGTTETVSSTTVSHTYTEAGTFMVKADVTIKKDNESCTSSPVKNVTVN